MRKLMLLAAMALVMPAAVQAQDGPRQIAGRAAMSANSVEWLLKSKDEFNASAEQVTKLEAVAKRFDTETEKLREEMDKARLEMRTGSADRPTMMMKMRPIREELQRKDEAAIAEAMQLLTDEQKKTVQSLLEVRREEMQSRRRPGNAPVKQ